MQKISISDFTIKKSGKGEYSLSFREKIEISKLLDRLCVSVIEVGGIENTKTDSLLIKSIASAVKDSTVAVSVPMDEDGPQTVWNALKEARHPRMQVECPVSPVQMEYFFHKKPAAMIAFVEKTVKACTAFCREVEFLAQDATRAEPAFLTEIVKAAVSAGASAVTLCGTSGTMLPDEFGGFLKDLFAAVPELSKVSVGVSCSDDLSMADSCAVEAIKAGASEIKAGAYGLSGASLLNVVRILSARGDSMGKMTSVRTTEAGRIVGQIADMCRTGRSKTSAFDNGVREDGEVTLTGHDSAENVSKVLEKQGYDLSEEDMIRVYENFLKIASKKESVGLKELDAIVAAAAMQAPPAFVLDSYVINSGNVISATAHLRLRKNGVPMEGVSVGDGPIDAAFLAIEQITGHHYELDDFQIRAVTEGREAMGETVVKLRSGGRLYSGRGISTDIIGSGIAAYINALNKIVYEEEEA